MYKRQDYAAQGQSILMENYRRYIDPKYSVRQLLVEHTHFNDPVKREQIKSFLLRQPRQGAVPIINYNDPVSVSYTHLDVYKRQIRIFGFRAIALAMATRCFWPPERPMPRSPTTVSYPSSSWSMNSLA